jgi:hypothetical protein
MKDHAEVDERYRSLLQKAVRRGQTELVLCIGALLESLGDPSAAWLEARSAVIVFEECWPLAGELHFTRGVHSKVATLMRVAAAPKARDATGLGFLAFALSRGNSSVLEGSDADKALRILARGIQQPAGFWKWIDANPAGERLKNLLAYAKRQPEGSRPHDKAVLLAAAYLACADGFPELPPAVPRQMAFPFWVAFDRHTAEGRRVLRDVSRDLHIPLFQLEWILYYFEGALTDAEAGSTWWQRYCRWQLGRIGLSREEALLIWQPARVQIADGLAEEARRLQADIYRWKLANLDRIASLRRQVEIFNQHAEEIKGGQKPLF